MVTGRTKGFTLRGKGNVVLVAAQLDDADGNPTEQYVFLRADEFGRLRTIGAGAVATFLGLTDTPGSYLGQGLLNVRVNAAEDALEFAAGGGATADFQEFLTSGTWTKPAGATIVIVEEWGAGGGGAGGEGRTSTAVKRVGGAGGGGGSYVQKIYDADQLGATEIITIGAGGTPGGGGTDALGSNGGTGGNTTFGSLLTAFGGGLGTAGRAGGRWVCVPGSSVGLPPGAGQTGWVRPYPPDGSSPDPVPSRPGRGDLVQSRPLPGLSQET